MELTVYIHGDCWRCGYDDVELVTDPMMEPLPNFGAFGMDLIAVCCDCAAERYVIHHERKAKNRAKEG